tara:strand:- start:1969 stop:2223 length:255 start_codon:yes stop_codon:yes gene_type:complete
MKYGQTKTESLAESGIRCRQIVREIIKFGMTQEQILKTIELLALELENIEHTKQITLLIKQFGTLNITTHIDDLENELSILDAK